jgi:pimeloyl-ACP methyl ester carboxylesterase
VPTVEGGPPEFPREHRPTADYYLRQAHDADGLAAELATPALRRAYIAGFYTHRLWGAPGAFTDADVAYMTAPYADADKLRASFANYESSMRTRPLSEPPRPPGQNPVETLVLYGPEDHVIQDNFPERCEAVFPNLVGPFVVPRAGHFLQWERPELLVRTLVAFCRDLLPRAA